MYNSGPAAPAPPASPLTPTTPPAAALPTQTPPVAMVAPQAQPPAQPQPKKNLSLTVGGAKGGTGRCHGHACSGGQLSLLWASRWKRDLPVVPTPTLALPPAEGADVRCPGDVQDSQQSHTA